MNSGRKVGRFKMSDRLIADADLQQLIAVQKNMFVLGVDQSGNLGFVVVTAMHPDFAELKEGDFIPFYECMISSDHNGDIATSFKRVE